MRIMQIKHGLHTEFVLHNFFIMPNALNARYP